MNSESSRSHSVFTCILECRTTDESGITQMFSSRLNLVDLAGTNNPITLHPVISVRTGPICLQFRDLQYAPGVIVALCSPSKSSKRLEMYQMHTLLISLHSPSPLSYYCITPCIPCISAGSERQRQSGATGKRLKEASGINVSLTVLGQVIMSLVDAQHGRRQHVPYRNSRLTFLLQVSLTTSCSPPSSPPPPSV